MAIPTFDYSPLPFAMPRYTPNTARLQQIYGDTGDQLSRISLERGRAQSEALARVAAIISSGIGTAREQKARKEATAIRASEREAERLEREAERKARAAERAADKAERATEVERGAARYAVEKAAPGPQSAALLALAQKFPETASRFRVQAPLPATVTPGAAGAIVGDTEPYAILEPTDEQALAAGDRQFRKERAAADDAARVKADARAATDDARQAASLAESMRHNRATEARLGAAASQAPLVAEAPVDPDSQDIMGQAGLTRNGFLALTNPTMLPRDQRTRNAASAEVAKWAAAKGIDTSTFASQFKGLNEVLQSNIERFNTVKNIEGELVGDVSNLKKAAKEAGLDDVKAINAAKLWLNGQLNDAETANYAFALRQLTSDIARYNAASSGRAPLESDMADARAVVQAGIAAGSLEGLETALDRSVQNMDTVLTGSVDRAAQGVWKLFGVGDKYRPNGGQKDNATPKDAIDALIDKYRQKPGGGQ